MWLILAVGCRDPDVAAFLDRRADAICARHAECGTLEAAGYASEDACRDALDEAEAALADEGALGCGTFDADAADACLADYADTPCDAAPDLAECDDVCE